MKKSYKTLYEKKFEFEHAQAKKARGKRPALFDPLNIFRKDRGNR
jgi:hypothetical protein